MFTHDMTGNVSETVESQSESVSREIMPSLFFFLT
jgi:hypothetical protein